MSKINTQFTVATKEMHAALGMVEDVKEEELAKKSASAKIAAEKEKSDRIREGYEKSNVLRKRNNLKWGK